MSFHLPRLYAITDTRLSDLCHADQVVELVRGGATFIQLREKHLTSGRFYQQAADAVRIAQGHRVKVIINDRVDIALALKADGVHLGQNDLSPALARRMLGPGAIIGFSVHSKEQAEDALRFPIDYLAAGPIFPTSSKQDPDPILGLNGLGQVRLTIGSLPLVAIGGINLQRADAVFQAGADAIAMISALLSPPGKIEANTAHFLHRICHKGLDS